MSPSLIINKNYTFIGMHGEQVVGTFARYLQENEWVAVLTNCKDYITGVPLYSIMYLHVDSTHFIRVTE